MSSEGLTGKVFYSFIRDLGLFGSLFLSLNFYYLSFIIHQSPFITLNTKVLWYYHSVSITHYFSHYLGGPHLSRCSFFFFQVPSNPNPGKKKQWRRPNQWERRRKKKVNWSKVAAEWVPHVCLITKMPLSYELWKLKTAKTCFQFP